MSEDRTEDKKLADQFACTDVELAPEAAERAWARFQQRREAAPAARGYVRRPVWLGAAACAVLVGTLGLSPAARSATAHMLSLFRISRVAALPVDVNANSPLASRTTAGMIQNLIADDLTVTRMEKNQIVNGPAAAALLTGFSPRYPAVLANPQFFVKGGKDFALTVDRSRAQAILDTAGVTGVELAPSLDGATVSVHVPRALAILQGDCSAWVQHNGTGLASLPSLGDCTIISEGPSPTASLPPGLDMASIAEAGLQLTGMSATAAQQLCQTVDWSSTLVVPFPRDAANSRDVTVDGASGILLTTSSTARRHAYILLWTHGGMLYSIAGPGDGSEGLTLASELPPA